MTSSSWQSAYDVSTHHTLVARMNYIFKVHILPLFLLLTPYFSFSSKEISRTHHSLGDEFRRISFQDRVPLPTGPSGEDGHSALSRASTLLRGGEAFKLGFAQTQGLLRLRFSFCSLLPSEEAAVALASVSPHLQRRCLLVPFHQCAFSLSF